MITLYQAPPAWGLPNMSPFCVKLETYLRMTKQEYKTAPGNPFQAPKGAIPYVDVDGKKLGDSELIIEYLKRTRGDSLDAKLSSEQRAVSIAVRRMIEEHLYFCGAHFRWKDDLSFQPVRDVFAKALPPVLGPFVIRMIRKDIIRRARKQGVGKHSDEEILAMARDDLASISALLGDKAFFHGSEPTTIDAVLYGFLVHMIWVPYDTGLVRTAKSFKNFEPYCKRMKERYWAS